MTGHAPLIERYGHAPAVPTDEQEAKQALLDQAGNEAILLRPLRAAARLLDLKYLAEAVEELADIRKDRREGEATIDEVEWAEGAVLTHVDDAVDWLDGKRERPIGNGRREDDTEDEADDDEEEEGDAQ